MVPPPRVPTLFVCSWSGTDLSTVLLVIRALRKVPKPRDRVLPHSPRSRSLKLWIQNIGTSQHVRTPGCSEPWEVPMFRGFRSLKPCKVPIKPIKPMFWCLWACPPQTRWNIGFTVFIGTFRGLGFLNHQKHWDLSTLSHSRVLKPWEVPMFWAPICQKTLGPLRTVASPKAQDHDRSQCFAPMLTKTLRFPTVPQPCRSQCFRLLSCQAIASKLSQARATQYS